MVWISLLLICSSLYAEILPRFLTKHAPETLRYISMDGRYAYIKKKPGVLGLVSSFRSIDFLVENNKNDFLIKSSRFKTRLAIESVPNPHDEMSLLKNHLIYVVDYGNTSTRLVGSGRNARLHLKDEWITFYDIQQKVIHVQNLVTQKKFTIKLSGKDNPFFIPEVEMISQNSLIYTDINESGYSALISYDLTNLKSNIIYKSAQTATQLELCQSSEYLAIGEFPYDGVNRGSSIQYVKLGGIVNLTGMNTLYSTKEQDIGNIVCHPKAIFFVKTMSHDKGLNYKVTEAVELDIKTKKVKAISNFKHVTQLLEMDGRILIPLRGQFYVIEGKDDIGKDTLKSVPTKEELQIEI
jgi:hypothetical protein